MNQNEISLLLKMMFRKATDIQSSWNPKIGDRICLIENDEPGIIITITRKHMTHVDMILSDHITGGSFWVPYQEDLEEICLSKGLFNTPIDLLSRFNMMDWIGVKPGLISMYWLLFTMEVCYGKVWVGNLEDWEPTPSFPHLSRAGWKK